MRVPILLQFGKDSRVRIQFRRFDGNQFAVVLNFGTGTIINEFGTINLVDSGSIIKSNSFTDVIVGTSCGSGTTLNVSTNECEADTTELVACNAALMTCSDELLMCRAPPEPTQDDDDDDGDSDDDDSDDDDDDDD